jgi:hypothetical protein
VKVHPEKLRGIEGLRARMIGREHEFAELKEAADQWLDGQGQIVSIIGEAGIGKSRLVGEIRDLFTETQSIFDFRSPILDSRSQIRNSHPHAGQGQPPVAKLSSLRLSVLRLASK